MGKRVSSRTTVAELRETLASMELDDHGKKVTLIRRLNGAYRREDSPVGLASILPQQPKRRPQPISSFLCFDVEATCVTDRTIEWPNEIIEFPVVLLQWNDPETAQAGALPTLKVVDTFHSYIRPVWRSELTTFCTTLTGISQETIDKSPHFPEVVKKFEKWLMKHELLMDGKLMNGVCWCTDGPWDLRDFIPKQLHITPLKPPDFPSPYPEYFLPPFLNVKEAVHNVLSQQWHISNPDQNQHHNQQYNGQALVIPRLSTQPGQKFGKKSPGFYRTLAGQLEALGLGEFKGRQHSGIDDAKNIARVVTELARRDVLLLPNAKIPPAANSKRFSWMGDQPGQIFWDKKNG